MYQRQYYQWRNQAKSGKAKKVKWDRFVFFPVIGKIFARKKQKKGPFVFRSPPEFQQHQPWIMKLRMTRWNFEPLYPKP